MQDFSRLLAFLLRLSGQVPVSRLTVGFVAEGRAACRQGPDRQQQGEISKVIRRRLFQNLGASRRESVAKAFGDQCFERRAQLPTE
jgi:hypothetical protein